MKKSNLAVGIAYAAVGVVLLLAAMSAEGKLGGVLYGFAGAGIGPGALMICQYFYWNMPGNKSRYIEKLANETIEQHDELKEKLRDKSGRYAYLVGLLTISLSMVVFSVLGAVERIDNSQIIVFYLGLYLLSQVVLGIVFFNRLLKKYQ